MKKLIYREGETPLGELKKQHEDGVVHICPECEAELIVALSEEEIEKHGMGKGIFCPNDLKHINVRIMGRRKYISF